MSNCPFFFLSFAVEFDDCAGNEDVQFEVSDPRFHVDADLNLVPHRDIQRTSPVLFIHGTSAHADDVADVDVGGWPADSAHTLRVSFIIAADLRYFRHDLISVL